MTFFLAALTGTLDKHNVFHFFAVRWTFDGATIGCDSQCFQLSLGDNILALGVRKLSQLIGIVRFKTGRLHDGTK